MSAIEIQNLKKTYNDTLEALKGISLTVNEGDFFGLLGPNGAGKSTTIGILCSLVTKTSGTVKIAGYDIDTHLQEAKTCLGVVPQEFNFNIFEPCWQILVNQAGYYGVPAKVAKSRIDELLEQLGLTDKRNTPSARLSGGLKRRLMIARALVHRPKILILDEPTAGVDISLRRSMWSFLTDLNEKGTTIILTTHYLEEAESLCKNLAIIDKGTLIAQGTNQELLQQLQSESIILYTKTPYGTLPSIEGFLLKPIDTTSFEVELAREQGLSALIEKLSTHNIDVDRVKNKSNRLEELFVKLVKG
jgi:ABC-2 type transport system ATP-binding protein